MVKAKLITKGEHYAKAMEAVKHLGGGVVKAGLLAGSSRAQLVKKGVRVVEYAYFHEYGTVNIPQRSFLRSTFNEQQDKWGRIFMSAVKDRLLQEGILYRGLAKVGDKMAPDIRDKINSNIPPPLKPATIKAKIKAKGADNKPELALVQYGDLLGAIDFEVVI